MFKPGVTKTFSILATTMLLASITVHAQAQNSAQRPASDEKRCQATGAANAGKAKDADLDSTYSACSLVDGFIGFGARINAGSSEPPQFGSDESGQALRRPQFDGNGHRLANQLAYAGDNTGSMRPRLGRAAGDYALGTRDFVSLSETREIEDFAAHNGAGRAYNRPAAESYLPLMTSSARSSDTPAAGGSGVGSGGAAGGIDSGNSGIGVPTAPPVAVVPEPATYAMWLAGLGLAFIARRRVQRRKD